MSTNIDAIAALRQSRRNEFAAPTSSVPASPASQMSIMLFFAGINPLTLPVLVLSVSRLLLLLLLLLCSKPRLPVPVLLLVLWLITELVA